MKENTLQDIYDHLYREAAHREQMKGEFDAKKLEEKVFTQLLKAVRDAIMRGEETTEALHELQEVKSFHIREEEEQRRKHEVEQAFKEGILLDFDLLKK